MIIASARCSRRGGFTLVEMLVVLALVLVLATLLVTFGPRMDEKRRAASGADVLQQWLLIAKQRALRDHVPTGLRLVQTTSGQTAINQLQYMQQPADFSVKGTLSFSSSSSSGAPFDVVTLTPASASSPNFIGDFPGTQSAWNVQPYDWLILPDNTVHLITTVGYGGNPLVLQINAAGAAQTQPPPMKTWSVQRGPRPIQGEQPLLLPKDVAIDISTNSAYLNPLPQFPPPPGPPPPGPIDIMFGTAGPVVSRGASIGKIILWVRDMTQPLTSDDQSLIVVYVRTGFIAAHRVDMTPSATGTPAFVNPYSFAQDGRSSGL
jgi:prepilin-type N-terminal cleavage/methylation domain-containing protein